MAWIRRRIARTGTTIVLVVAAVFFIAPLLSMARFSMQNVLVLKLGWHTLFKRWSFAAFTEAFHEPGFGTALWYSARLAVLTVFGSLALMVPTALLVELRLRRFRGLVEFLTVLPYIIPPVALVAGVAAFFRPNARWFMNSPYSLVPLYMVLALPFTYRSIDASVRSIDVRVLVDASRSLGAGWITTLFRVLVPNIATGLLSAGFLTLTVVFGEFTIAGLLSRNTFPVFVFAYQSHAAQGGIALALLTMAGTTALLATITFLTRMGRGRRAKTTK
jgi:putative spermidine/putrescine transport system permease protein